jgi:hypothetical protein
MMFLMDLLTNIFVKPATTPYRLQVKNMEAEIEKSLTLKVEISTIFIITRPGKVCKCNG